MNITKKNMRIQKLSKLISSFVLFILFFLSCDQTYSPSIPLYDCEYIDSVCIDAIITDDLSSFRKMIVEKDYRRIPYAMIMAANNGHPELYNDLFYQFEELYDRCGIHLDSTNSSLIINMLYEGAKYNDIKCMDHLAFLYHEGKYVKKDSVKSKQYMLNCIYFKNIDLIDSLKKEGESIKAIVISSKASKYMQKIKPGRKVSYQYLYKDTLYTSVPIWIPNAFSEGDTAEIIVNKKNPQSSMLKDIVYYNIK
jgi:hypothetical protein